MTKLTKKDVLHVAELSNLDLTDAEIETFIPQLSKIVEYVGQLSEVDTSQVEPTSQTTGLTNVLRKDEIKDTNILSVTKATSQAPTKHKNFFKVKAILTERADK